MNEEQLIEFVNWLPSVVPEFKNATPDQIVQALNQMSESDEGQQMLSQLINTFQQAKQSADSQMFKKGGKLAAFVSKYGKGGEMCCKKKAILQGGMVNKVAEKMQEGNKVPEMRINSILFPATNYNYPLNESFDRSNSVDTTKTNRPNFFQKIRNWWEKTTQPDVVEPQDKSIKQLDRLSPYAPSFLFPGLNNKPDASEFMGKSGGSLPKAQGRENDTNDWFQSMILEELPNMNYIQRRELGPNSYVHELSATHEGLNNPTLGRMIETNPNTGQSDTTYVRFFMDPFTEPIFTNMTGSAKRQADSKIEGLRDKANSKGAKIRK